METRIETAQRAWLRRGSLLAGALAALLAGQSAATAEHGLVRLAPAAGPAVRLYVEDEGQGPPVVLLHGLGASSFAWRNIAHALEATHRVIAVDLKGFGRSDKPEDADYSAEAQAALVARLIADLGLRNVTLVGHSFGGTVALRTTLRPEVATPGTVTRLVLLAAPALPGSLAQDLQRLPIPETPTASTAAVQPDAMARLLLAGATTRRAALSDDVIAGYAAPYRSPGAMAAFLASARALVSEQKGSDRLPAVKDLKLPALLVWCRGDSIVPLRAGRRLAKALPNARLAVLDGCLHLPHEEQPAKLLGLIRTFIDR